MSSPQDRQADAQFTVTGRAPEWALDAWDEPAGDDSASGEPPVDEQLRRG